MSAQSAGVDRVPLLTLPTIPKQVADTETLSSRASCKPDVLAIGRAPSAMLVLTVASADPPISADPVTTPERVTERATAHLVAVAALPVQASAEVAAPPAVELLRYVQHPKNTDEWVDCGKEVDIFLEKQDKENKDER